MEPQTPNNMMSSWRQRQYFALRPRSAPKRLQNITYNTTILKSNSVYERKKIAKSRVPAGIQTGNLRMLVTYPRHWTCVNATILTVSIVVIAGYGNMYNAAHFSGMTNACAIGSFLHPFRPWNHSLILGYRSPSTLRAFLFNSLSRRFFLSSWLSLSSCTPLPNGHNRTFRMLCSYQCERSGMRRQRALGLSIGGRSM